MVRVALSLCLCAGLTVISQPVVAHSELPEVVVRGQLKLPSPRKPFQIDKQYVRYLTRDRLSADLFERLWGSITALSAPYLLVQNFPEIFWEDVKGIEGWKTGRASGGLHPDAFAFRRLGDDQRFAYTFNIPFDQTLPLLGEILYYFIALDLRENDRTLLNNLADWITGKSDLEVLDLSFSKCSQALMRPDTVGPYHFYTHAGVSRKLEILKNKRQVLKAQISLIRQRYSQVVQTPNAGKWLVEVTKRFSARYRAVYRTLLKSK